MCAQLNVEYIVEQYQNGQTISHLAKEFDVTIDKIRYHLNKQGVLQKRKVAKHNLPEQQIIDLYKQDHTPKQIADRFGVSESPIVTILKKHNVRKPNWLKALPYATAENVLDKQYVDQLVDHFVTIDQIKQFLNCGADMVASILKYHNIQLPSSARQRSLKYQKQKGIIPITKQTFETYHFEYNLPLYQIAEYMGISVNYLRRYVKQWGITLRDSRISNEFRQFKTFSKQHVQQLVNQNTLAQLREQYNVSGELLTKHLQQLNISIPVRYVSSGEQEIFDFVKQFCFDAQQTNRSIIAPYELDIFIPSKNVAIEYCGLYWHSELNGKNKDYHLNKTIWCEQKGIQLITIFEDEYIYNQQMVLNKIKTIIGVTNNVKINARDCHVKEIDAQTKAQFLNANHLQGSDVSKIKLGLFTKQNHLVAVMTFSTPSRARASKSMVKQKDIWELNRFATDINYNVRGAAGKLLKYFKQNYQWQQIYSYADRRWSTGDLYNKLGFTHQGTTKPNYWYFYQGQPKRHYRYNFTKYKLVEQGYDPNLTEYQIMQQRGFSRIWDCGHHKYVINNLKR